MTEKSKKMMKEIMQEILRKQGEEITPEQNGWFQYADNCISAEICPECGSEIFVNAGEIDKEIGTLSTLIECSTCEWKSCDYAEPPQ